MKARALTALLAFTLLDSRSARAQVAPTAPEPCCKACEEDEDKEEEEEDRFASYTLEGLKGGKLMRYGLTLGVGTVVQLGGGPSRVDGPAVGSISYAAVFPAWWGIRGDITRAYCGSHWQGGNAQKVANDIATRRAKAKLGKKEVTDDEIASATGWDPRLAGRCGLTYLPGLYVGVPGDFTADIDTGSGPKSREFSPQVSVGLAWAPFSLVTVLAGMTRSTVPRDTEASGIEWSWNVGLGANLDILGFVAGD